jgi:hypothetical protein
LFELLLQRGEFGEWRIRIRLLVAPVGATVRLGEILLPLGSINALAVTARSARSILAVPTAVSPITSRRVAVLAVLALVPILPRLTVLPLVPAGPVAALTSSRRIGRRRGCSFTIFGRPRSALRTV